MLAGGLYAVEPMPADVIRKKLKNITIPEVTFKETAIGDAVDWLRSASFKFDTDKKQKGINFVLMNNPKKEKDDDAQKKQVAPSITMEVQNISLMETLNLVTKLAGMKWRISGSVVKILPGDYPDTAIEYRVYDVLPGSLDKARQMMKDIEK